MQVTLQRSVTPRSRTAILIWIYLYITRINFILLEHIAYYNITLQPWTKIRNRVKKQAMLKRRRKRCSNRPRGIIAARNHTEKVRWWCSPCLNNRKWRSKQAFWESSLTKSLNRMRYSLLPSLGRQFHQLQDRLNRRECPKIHQPQKPAPPEQPYRSYKR